MAIVLPSPVGGWDDGNLRARWRSTLFLSFAAAGPSPTLRGMFAQVSPAPVDWWPFLVLAVSVGFIVLGIAKLRLHPFIALILAGLLAGLLAKTQTWQVVEKSGDKKAYGHLTGTVEMLSKGLGDAARDIAISIALASIIGMCLMESGAADRVVRRFLKFFGEKRAAWALLWSTYVLSIPIFFDTMFMLMVPLARALRLRTGKDYTLYVLAVCCGGVITHSMTVPHPGPIAAVESLHLDVGVSLVGGILGGMVPAFFGFFACQWLNRRTDVPLRETPGTSLAELRSLVDRDERELPSFFASILPVILPIALISFSSFVKVAVDYEWGAFFRQPALREWIDFIGNKNIALLVGTALSLVLLARQRGFGLKKLESLMGPPLETAGMIILITSAGGAFGFMLRSAGVGDAVKSLAVTWNLNLVVLAYVVALIIRVAQGSATVAMLTTSSIIAPMLAGAELPFHKVYLFLAIGWGAMGCSWMNDSGFWVVSRLGGLTERETLRTWTAMLTFVSVVGFLATWLASKLIPLV